MEKGKRNSVAIILLNWNAYKDTFECIKSLESINNCSFKVFLADNDSQDTSFQQLQKDYSNGLFIVDLEFIQTGGNLGFAGGNNVAIRKAYEQGFEYFWMLNNDTTINGDTLTPLIDTLQNNESVGIVGSKILYYGTNKIWFAGGKVNTWTGRSSHFGLGEEDNGQYEQEIEVDYITGCSLCFPRTLLDDIGYMNEDYFLYYEETDWNLRARNRNWKIIYNPKSIVYHKISASTGGEQNPSPLLAYYDLRNAYWMIKRTQPIYKRPVALTFKYLKSLKKILRIILNNQDRKASRLKLILKALVE